MPISLQARSRRTYTKLRRKPVPVCIIKPGEGKLWNINQPAPRSTIDYKNTKLLIKFISPQGKILPRRATGLSAQQQRVMARAIKRARMSGLLPFVNREDTRFSY